MRYEVVYCDDIRQEINGKLFLIGVYSSDAIVSPTLPSQVAVSIFVKVWDLPFDEYVVYAQLADNVGNTLWTNMTGELKVQTTDFPSVIHFGQCQFTMLSPGFVTVNLAFKSKTADKTLTDQVSRLFIAARTPPQVENF